MKGLLLTLLASFASQIGPFCDGLTQWQLGKARQVGVQSAERLRFEGVVEQGLDRSCGLASIVTLVSVYWGHSITEAQIVDEANVNLDTQGLVTMKFLSDYLSKIGFVNEAYEIDYEGLTDALKSYSPAIIHYKWPDLHFALALTADEEGVTVADSARGLEFVERGLFMARWSGLVLFASSNTDKRQSQKIEDSIRKKREQRANLIEFWKRIKQ